MPTGMPTSFFTRVGAADHEADVVEQVDLHVVGVEAERKVGEVEAMLFHRA